MTENLGRVSFCATPIGNIEDISLRTLKTLRKADIIYCEDTRHSRILMNHYKIKTPLKSYHKFNERSRLEEVIDRIRRGDHIAVISDAGMPGISDPGEVLIQYLLEGNLPFEVLPGASAAVTAVVLSGLEEGRHLYWGFLPSKSGARRKTLSELKSIPVPIVFYESPHRIKETIEDIYAELGDRRLTIAREITKKFEELVFLRAGDDLTGLTLKGEFVLVVHPQEGEEAVNIKELLEKTMAEGHSLSKAVKLVSKTYDLPKNEVYREGLELK